MPIIYTTGNILESNAQAIVIPVNCCGVMGAGLAKQARQKWPDYYERYKVLCKCGSIKLGHPYIQYPKDKIIINFPTKHHWKDKSRIEDIDKCLGNMIIPCGVLIRYEFVKAMAVPRLGCGLGGLNWRDVKPLIEKHLSQLPIDVMVYE